MRLWSLHPRYLDPQGLVALWREALLAQAVLLGKTKGYKHHPQLLRFQSSASPERAIGTYLTHVCDEAESRGYTFDATRIVHFGRRNRLVVTTSQLAFEMQHLRAKLRVRSPASFKLLPASGSPSPHPMFIVRSGPIEPWERINT
jgi:Pyrimidine dimer DNA glycosylase